MVGSEGTEEGVLKAANSDSKTGMAGSLEAADQHSGFLFFTIRRDHRSPHAYCMGGVHGSTAHTVASPGIISLAFRTSCT